MNEVGNVIGEYEDYGVYSNDIGLWPNTIKDSFKEYFVLNPPKQNMDRIKNSKKFLYGGWRSLKTSHFYHYTKNQQKINRQWLVYSEQCAKLFCYVCKLFNHNDKRQLCQSGFDDWVHISKRLTEHENSTEHRNAVCTLSIRVSSLKRIDQEIVTQHNKEIEY